MSSADVRPWFCRLLEVFPRPPWGGAFAVAVGLGLLQATGYLGYRLLAERPVALSGELVVSMVVYSVGLAAMVSLAGWMVVVGAGRDVAAMGAALPGAAQEHERRGEAFVRFPPRRLHAASFLAVLVPPLLHLVSPGAGGPTSRLLDGSLAGFRDVYALVTQLAFWWVLGAIGYTWLADCRRFWQLGRREVRVDLLDLGALAPFARFGLRLVLVVCVIPLLVALAAAAGYPPARVEWLLLVPLVATGALGLLVPSWGLHVAIRETKSAELARVTTAIAGNRAALSDSPLAKEADALSLVELLQYREHVEGLREWPIDSAILRRFGLYLLIPVASWVGGALVERLVSRFF